MIGNYTSKNLHTEHLCLTTEEESRNPSESFKYFNHTQKELGCTEGGKMPACRKESLELCTGTQSLTIETETKLPLLSRVYIWEASFLFIRTRDVFLHGAI